MSLVVEPPQFEAPPLIRGARWHTEWHLENWARHMNAVDLPEGMPEQACAGENYTSEDLENEDEYDRLCVRLADTTSLVIGALPDAERHAILHRYIAGAPYPFHAVGTPYALALASAMDLVQDGLRRRGVWLGE